MVKKSAALMGRAAIWLATILLVTFLLLLARIMLAPLDVTFAKTFVEGQTKQILPGWTVNFDKAEVQWNWSNVRLELNVDGLYLVDRLDRLRADIPTIKVDISRSLLYAGGVQLIRFESNDAVISVTDLAGFSDEDQQPTQKPLFKKAGNDVSYLTPAGLQPLTAGLSRFARRLLSTQKELEDISFNNLHVIMAAGKGKAPVNMHLSFMRMVNETSGLTFEARGHSDLGDLPTEMRLFGRIDTDKGELALNVGLNDLNVVELATSFDLGDILKSMEFPVSLNSEVLTSATEGVKSVRGTLQIGEGRVYHPYHFPDKGVMKGGTITLEFDPKKSELKIAEGHLTLFQKSEMQIDLSGLIYWQKDQARPGFDFQAKSPMTTIDHVKAFWPVLTSKVSGKPQGGRTWVADNILAMTAHDIVFDVSVGPDGKGKFKDNSPLQLTFTADKMVVDYVNGMPHLVDGKVKSILTNSDITIDVLEATSMGLPLGGSTVLIDWSKKRSENALGVFNIKTSGQVTDIMKLLSHPPLKLDEKFTFDTGRLAGVAEASALLEIPLIQGLKNEDMTLDAKAKLTKVKVDDILSGEGLRDADLMLSVSLDQLYVEGKGRLNGVPLSLSWLEDFKAGRTDPKAYTTRTVIAGEIEAKDLSAFGIDGMGRYSSGKMPIEATFLGRSMVFTEGYFSADATPATLKFDLLAWQKKVGRIANINGALLIDDQKISLSPLNFLGEAIDVDIKVDWDKSNPLSDGSMPFVAVVTANELDNHKLTATIKSNKVNYLDVTINGDRLDMGDLLSGRRQSALESSDSSNDYSVDLTLKMNRVLLKNGIEYHDAMASLFMDQGDPEAMSLQATDRAGFPLTGSITGRETKGRGKKKRSMNPLTIKTENGGELLRGLGVFAHGQSGTLSFDGEIMGWQGKDFNVSGVFAMEDMMLVRANKLPKGVTEGVLEGIDEFVDEEGLLMKKAKGKFVFKDTILDISSFKANSSNLGITLEGQYEDTTRRINMNGVVVPAYGVNSFLGKIPIIGGILTGGSGKGVFGVTYRLKGQGSNAKFTINPLSAVTPGFLRNIFEGEKGKIKDVKDDGQGGESETNVPTPEKQEPAKKEEGGQQPPSDPKK